jgi:exodeoxyribonuclease VII large subunit
VRTCFRPSGDLEQRFDEATLRMQQAMTRFTTSLRHRERVAQARLAGIDLRMFIRGKSERLSRSRQLLTANLRAGLQKQRARLEVATGRLNALSPLAILARGYAICRDARGILVRNAENVMAGDGVCVTLAKGELDCRVEGVRLPPGD